MHVLSVLIQSFIMVIRLLEIPGNFDRSYNFGQGIYKKHW